MKQKHTTAPTPLEVNEGKRTPGKVQTDGLAIIGERPELEICVVTCDDDIRRSEAEANAARIAECWNMHDVILSANEQLQKTVDELNELAQSAGRKHVQANIDLHNAKADNEALKEELETGANQYAAKVMENEALKEANRELLAMMDEVLSEWHKKSSNFTKTEPAYLEKIRKAISKHSKQTT